MPDMITDLGLLDKLKARVHLARRIDQAQHKTRKANHDRNWMKETAEAMELELGSDFAKLVLSLSKYWIVGSSVLTDINHFAPSSESDDDKPSGQQQKARDTTVGKLKTELKHLLSQPLVARGISVRYITSGSDPIVEDILAGECKFFLIYFFRLD